MARRSPFLAVVAALTSGLAAAAPLSCYEDPATNKNICYQPSRVTENGSVRASPIFIGGPKGVQQTPYTIVTDCAKGITTLQDRQGVNFAGARSADTKANRSLAKWICDEPKVKKDKSLRMFGD